MQTSQPKSTRITIFKTDLGSGLLKTFKIAIESMLFYKYHLQLFIYSHYIQTLQNFWTRNTCTCFHKGTCSMVVQNLFFPRNHLSARLNKWPLKSQEVWNLFENSGFLLLNNGHPKLVHAAKLPCFPILCNWSGRVGNKIPSIPDSVGIDDMPLASWSHELPTSAKLSVCRGWL